MVKSGLEKPREEGQEVNVSPYRLCMHLTSAFVIYSYVMWLALSVLRPAPSATASAAVKAVKKLAHASAGVLGITIISGTTVIFLLLLTSQPLPRAPPILSSRCFCRWQPRRRVLPRMAADGRLFHAAAHVGHCSSVAQLIREQGHRPLRSPLLGVRSCVPDV
jgi:hypothetical protein